MVWALLQHFSSVLIPRLLSLPFPPLLVAIDQSNRNFTSQHTVRLEAGLKQARQQYRQSLKARKLIGAKSYGAAARKNSNSSKDDVKPSIRIQSSPRHFLNTVQQFTTLPAEYTSPAEVVDLHPL